MHKTAFGICAFVPQQRQAVLRAQGGVSFGAVFLCVLLLSVCGSAFTLLLGPDLQAILNAFYG